eukprot:Skav216155  [mRNA]  locus=scaffold3788:74687:92825:+ [translate_table: standard]
MAARADVHGVFARWPSGLSDRRSTVALSVSGAARPGDGKTWWFHHGQRSSGAVPTPRAVLVDAEPKVVERLLTPLGARKPWSGDRYAFDPSYAATAQSGRGGNFALGYTGELAGRSSTLDGVAEPLWSRSLQLLRQQAEACHGAHLGAWAARERPTSRPARDLIPHLCPAEEICDFAELLRTISPLPSHKFAQIFSAGVRQRFNYESETMSKVILDSVKRCLPRSARNSQNVLSAKCAVHGVLQVSQDLKLELLERLGGAAPLKSQAMDLKSWPHPLKSAPSARVSILMNWRRITKTFRELYQQAQQKYASRMFLHWYDMIREGDRLLVGSFCARMKRGMLTLGLSLGAGHLDDFAESFLMSAFRNGSLRTMKARPCRAMAAKDLRVCRPLVNVREKTLANFAKENRHVTHILELPVIADNCPACFAAPKGLVQLDDLATGLALPQAPASTNGQLPQEFEHPDLFWSLSSCMKPLMSIAQTEKTMATCRPQGER